MRQNEFEAMITDSTKTILGDIASSEDEDHSPVVEFRVQLRESPAGLQVEVQHFAEKMLHGQNVSAVEFGGAYRAPGAEG